MKDTSDIENIIVATHEHTPIYVRDVAEVKIGAELRQGAVTANGEGEAVAGIVLMLKGASGRDVVNAVKEKLPAIQKALPKGVELVPFYDRTDLVQEGDPHRHESAARRRDLRAHHPHRAARRCAQRDHRHARSAARRALRLHHDEVVWPEREPDVARRPRHRHRHDGRWRGRDGGKHPSPSDGETRRERKRTRTADKIETVLYAAKEVGRPIVFGIFIIIIVFLPLFTLQGFEGKMFARSRSRFRSRCSAR